MASESSSDLLLRIAELERRLAESDQLIEAIKAGEVDAFAITNGNESEIYTLQSGDYAYRLLIEECGEGAINITDDGTIVYSNQYFHELLKLPYEKVIGSSIYEIVDIDSRDKFTMLLRVTKSGKSKGEINLCINDHLIPVYISITSLQPKLDSIGIIITDLTEKKKHENLILDYQKDLEKKNLELIQSNTDLASFAYVASHDLQEPLRKIQTFATRILEKEIDNLSEIGKDHFHRIHSAAERMQKLIVDLLLYSRTNTADRQFQDVDLNEILAEVKTELKDDLQQKHATLDATNMCHAYIIPFQFRQLLHNLINNSLKFAKPDEDPYIKIRSEIKKGAKFENDKLEPEQKYCHISISDNGIGFEQAYSEKIFELFQRLHGKLSYVGTGIGLAIVKKIVENHSGIITASSEVNEGATFDIFLPSP
ncbi:MAG TPA: ATP-binding protein [Saprospiraceae bacterium]|nr:ATP-binding protein [Saprospiraceae bacterium]